MNEITLLSILVLYLLTVITIWTTYLAHLFYRYVAGTNPPKLGSETEKMLGLLCEQLLPYPFGRTTIGPDRNIDDHGKVQ